MYADLNVPVQDSSTNKEILQFLADYGYECVAFNHEVKLEKKVQIKSSPDLYTLVDNPPVPKGCRRAMKVLQRLTVTVEDASVLHVLSSPPLDSYDILAICPGTDKVLQQACSVLNVDIISLKLDERLPFKLRHAQIGQAVQRGIYFEICYSPAIKDATARKHILANAMELVDVSRRKNIIVSSQAAKGLDVRGPADVINLCHLFGLKGGMCKSTITSHCRAVLLHSAMRRKTVKGVVACELISEEPPQDESTSDVLSDVISVSSEEAMVDPTMEVALDPTMATADTPESVTAADSPSQITGGGPHPKKRTRRSRRRGKRRNENGDKPAAKRTKLD